MYLVESPTPALIQSSRRPSEERMEIGKKAYETLRRARFVEKSVRFSSTIHRTNLKSFLTIHKPEKGNTVTSSGRRRKMPK